MKQYAFNFTNVFQSPDPGPLWAKIVDKRSILCTNDSTRIDLKNFLYQFYKPCNTKSLVKEGYLLILHILAEFLSSCSIEGKIALEDFNGFKNEMKMCM